MATVGVKGLNHSQLQLWSTKRTVYCVRSDLVRQQRLSSWPKPVTL